MSSPPDIPPCAPYTSTTYSPYGYLPSLPAGITFSILFGIITILNAFNTFRTKYWWMGFFFTAGGLLETIGWVGRTVAHYCVFDGTVSTMQIASLIMGPAYTQSGVYISLWLLLLLLPPKTSPLKPKLYLLSIFTLDCICLTLQAIGGGLAGAAFEDNTSTSTGTTIMVAGIIAQLVSGCVFLGFLGVVVPRAWGTLRQTQNRRLALVAGLAVLSTGMMVLRGFYRSVELLQGWRGYLILSQGFLVGLDAVPMLVAMGGLAVCNPGVLVRAYERENSEGREKPLRVESEEESV